MSSPEEVGVQDRGMESFGLIRIGCSDARFLRLNMLWDGNGDI